MFSKINLDIMRMDNHMCIMNHYVSKNRWSYKKEEEKAGQKHT